MKLIDSNLQLPKEFTKSIPTPETQQHSPDELLHDLREQNERRHPLLVALNPCCYRVPITAALYLYRRDPKKHRTTVLEALGTPRSSLFGLLLSAAARDAAAHQDWALLGRLAWRLESAAAEFTHGTWDDLSKGSDDSPPMTPGTSWRVSPGRIQAAFLRLLEYPKGTISALGYVTFALSFLASVPDSFVFPPDWWIKDFEKASGATNEWAILKMLCHRNGAAWLSIPKGLERLGSMNHPFLQFVAETLKRQKPLPPPPAQMIRNPFIAVAGKTGQEPPKGKLGQLARKAADIILGNDSADDDPQESSPAAGDEEAQSDEVTQ